MLAEAEKVLYQLDKLLEQSNRMDKVFRTYLQGIARSFHVRRVSLMLLDEARQELFIHESEGLFRGLKDKTRVRLGEGISGRVAAKGEAVLVADVSRDRLIQRERRGKGYRAGGFISIPIKVRGKVYGVLNVSERTNRKPFAVEDLKRLELFGMQLAILVENEKLRRDIERLEKKPVEEIVEISHDFRIPLVCVQEVLSLMEKEELGPVTDSQREFLELAKRSVNRMITTFDHLITIASRVDHSARAPEKVELGEMLQEITRNFEARARRRRVRLALDLPGEASWVETDRIKIHEVFMNLVDNAVKHTHEGTDVQIRLRSADHGVRLEVEDHGPGIPEGDKVSLFDKAASMKRFRKSGGGGEGHGLGLAISHDIVQMLGGKIGFHSERSNGSTFYVELPRNLIRIKRHGR